MFVDFNKLPDHARIWIYVSDKPIASEQKIWLSSSLRSFLEKWTAHGNNLKSSFTLLYNQILVIGLDESVADASGCSIDASVHFIKEVGSYLKVDFFNRDLVPFIDNEVIKLEKLSELKEKMATSEVSGETTIFNTLVTDKKTLPQAETALKDSWLKRYLKNPEISG